MKTKFKGTQGNWEINPIASRNVRCNGRTVANCSSGQDGENEDEEKLNAKLIANAPKILYALENILRWSAHFPPAMNGELHFAENVIKEAVS